ncbi:glycosyltransferase [Cecembia calidifontis]|uniref:GalNAc-alpha-(1->4)-GalNAc-alpha-(1->3)-diNAcBac-PP-undecaprenol alpha-1,4-N-acetyl-D-galactosaminyltransferase n=1 Tax=Cecembia calidifontis TaxID=1187080 RepID=A0A4Q7PFK9_9BACT|nr:glycosyltransferase [Cecembia calidifontis]RZS98460.1 GalNAc-alpha-(1->4)-GalNAc-alpha-(1->3)-diNAcBac-PP-undecaprenol alpha-1,4-N-acetyl-D-galactosaminyltransferase [Cecembia calidifontis]
MQKIVLITSDLSPGGAERVMATLANNFAQRLDIEVHLVCLVQGKLFYTLDSKVILHLPDFYYKRYPKFFAYLKAFFYLRKKLKDINPKSYLSFGGRYNALCILAGLGLKSKSFISDRSRPGISYGRFFNILNRLVYPYAYGIVAQTNRAKQFHLSQFKHDNIKIIGNPIPDFYDSSFPKKNVILNVGRFISSKNQQFLIDVFDEIDTDDWELWFVGDGPFLEKCKKHSDSLKSADKIKFLGNTEDIMAIYNAARIYAFTSTSEGFPNALGEALSAGLACISFDCNAGPSDLIEDGINGFLVKELDKKMFKKRLIDLISEKSTFRIKFTAESQKRIKNFFNEDFISNEYLSFMIIRLYTSRGKCSQ